MVFIGPLRCTSPCPRAPVQIDLGVPERRAAPGGAAGWQGSRAAWL